MNENTYQTIAIPYSLNIESMMTKLDYKSWSKVNPKTSQVDYVGDALKRYETMIRVDDWEGALKSLKDLKVRVSERTSSCDKKLHKKALAVLKEYPKLIAKVEKELKENLKNLDEKSLSWIDRVLGIIVIGLSKPVDDQANLIPYLKWLNQQNDDDKRKFLPTVSKRYQHLESTHISLLDEAISEGQESVSKPTLTAVKKFRDDFVEFCKKSKTLLIKAHKTDKIETMTKAIAQALKDAERMKASTMKIRRTL